MSAFVFVEVCGYICAPISIASNVLLLLVVRGNTSRNVAPFKLCFVLSALTGIVLSVTFLLCQPCVLLNERVVLVVLLGPSVFVHPVVATMCFVLFEAAFVLCVLQVASPYLFKVLIRMDKNELRWQIISVVTVVVITWLVVIAPMVYFSTETASEVRTHQEHYERIILAYTKFIWVPHFVSYKLNAIGKLWLIFLVAICIFGCAIVALRATLSSGLMQFTNWRTNLTPRFSQIANTSRLNACSAAALVVGPLLLFSIFAVNDQPTYSYSIPLFLGAAFLPILNAHFIIFNVRTFRKSVSSILSFKQKVVGPISHVSSEH
ncbi:unnamed protein product [Heligmosomoides polygyrus]|uniref:G_PROTEIN_RECEP_F1_2 domain-containing protein n=1 Tax=Heligmosomoides polygyrus TaxID=6339 RepID=A0A183FTU9_HELPZ|nr:unnamed protein product [Heligmosomoides polygyrus]